MTIRAKMKCTAVTKQGDNENVSLSAVGEYDETGVASGENAEWSAFTPRADAHLVISKSGAQGRFITGTEYFVDFTEASPETKAAPTAG
jgi:hypothetical protein